MYFWIKYFRTLEKNFNKNSSIYLITTLILACNAEKRVPDGKQLLMKNQITVNVKLPRKNMSLINCIKKPNSTLLGFRLRLNLWLVALTLTQYQIELLMKSG
jgi:hypothetical protein